MLRPETEDRLKSRNQIRLVPDFPRGEIERKEDDYVGDKEDSVSD